MIIKNDKLYDVLKWVATVGLPAITALWLGLSKVWGFPFAEEIGATLALITTFLGALLGIGSIKYHLLNSEKNEAEG